MPRFLPRRHGAALAALLGCLALALLLYHDLAGCSMRCPSGTSCCAAS